MPKKKLPDSSHQNIEKTESSSSEDEWEDVAESNNNQVKGKGVEIELDMPDTMKSKQTKKIEQAKEWIAVLIKRAINKSAKEIQIRMHKTHLLCLLTSGMQLNRLCLNKELQCLAFSILDNSFSKQHLSNNTKENIERITTFVKKKFVMDIDENSCFTNIVSTTEENFLTVFSTGVIKKKIDMVLVFVLLLRSVGLACRLTMSLHPLPLKPLTEKQKETKRKQVEMEFEKIKNKPKSLPSSSQLQIPQLDGAADEVLPSRKRNLRRKSPAVQVQEASVDLPSELNQKKRKSAAKKTLKKSAAKTKTFSKYLFSSEESQSLSDESSSAASKISAMVKMSNNKSKDGSSKNENKRACSVLITKQKKSKQLTVRVATILHQDRKSMPIKVDLLYLNEIDEKSESSQTKSASGKKNVKKSPSENKTKPTKHKTKSKDNEFNGSLKPSKQPKLQNKDKNINLEKTAPKQSKLRQRAAKKNYVEKMSDVDSDSDDEDFDYDKVVFKTQPKKKPKKSSPAARRLSTEKKSTKSLSNQWLEVYVKKVGWVPVDCFSGLIVEPRQMEQSSRKPLHYVLAFDNDQFVKDVTVRYASDWLITTRKLRVNSVDQDWWKETLNPYKTKNKRKDEEENKQMESNLLSQPLPTSISAFKSHPLFALRRHLLKYEAIYPPDVPSIGFIKGEEVLPRSAVHVLHTREKWLQAALSVKCGETPYKMVASYLLNKKLNKDSDAPSLALFGKWQTETYQPPVAVNGKVPRNDYGNVDLFQPSMLPIGCVHLRLPSLNVVARKLNIDIATAIIGFDTHHGFPHPVTDGYVACEEHEKILREAWEEEQAHAEEKAREKIEKRVYSRWKTFIRGLYALEKVRKKYTSKAELCDDISSKSAPKVNDTVWQAAKLKEAKEQFEQKRRRGRKKKNTDSFPVEVETM